MNQMQRQLRRRLPVELLQKFQPLGVPVPCRCLAQNLSVQIREGGKQRDRAMAGVIVRACAHLPDAQGQARLRAFQRLALALSVNDIYSSPVTTTIIPHLA